MRVALVGCGKAKRAGRHFARSLYTGGLFRAALAHAEEHADRVFILSGLHGLLYLDSDVESYEHRLQPADVPAWTARVVEDLRGELAGEEPELAIYAGREYAEPVAAALRALGWPVTLPLAGLEIGERLHWFKEQREGCAMQLPLVGVMPATHAEIRRAS